MKFLALTMLLVFNLNILRVTQAEDRVTEDYVRITIEKSLPYLEEAGVSWIEDKKCVTCHRVSFQTWSFNKAASAGFPATAQKSKEWLDWSIAKSVEPNEDGTALSGETNVDGLAQLIIAHPDGSSVPLPAEARQQFVEMILKTQLEDGSWKPAGQLPMQKRPAAETAQVSTMWNLIALHQTGQDEQIQKADEKAKEWLAKSTLGLSTEWYAVQILLADITGETERVQSAIEQLKSFQQEDGSWGWLTAEPGDALATGQALYALKQVGVSNDDPSIQKAIHFLTSTQAENGSWSVHGTKAKKKENVEETAVYWGTAWATIGLLETLEKTNP
ncbi:prenyltransferase/squalene oxidase repeat-containing protein [uncultured Rubinisphaera sp.]|uniref:prenyltransferase/squalene oxidase repeat-containing protein n=1 Tax=uncultured Rubinisphaera sp. TaxID=1678686 RepID=UPI0030D79CCB